MKKYTITFFFLLSSFAIKAEVFTWATEKNKEQKVEIKKLDGILVNDECFSNKTVCLKIIAAVKKDKSQKKPEKGPLGNPASTKCSMNKGQSEILRDGKHNEYDFCLFEQKYLIDSWALMK